MRGFRPSYFQIHGDEFLDDLDRTKQENIERYIHQAEAGQPLFEETTGMFISQSFGGGLESAG
ncbi:MAG: hypothetical protein KAR11_01915 [Phycisphaerae bacterium]|nr:hypothetical protein [Phycisphaerae bacterium]